MANEYKSTYREHVKGRSYQPADDLLNEQAADGWDLVSVVVVPAIYKTAVYEIFYFERKVPGGPAAVPQDNA